MYGKMNTTGCSNEIKGDFKYPASKFSEFLFEWLEPFIQATVVILFFFVFFFRIMSVVGQSMLDTLHDSDKIVVWKLNYTPTNGDVVTIVRGQHYDKPIVKRVIATQGQKLRIDFSDGSVFVNDEKLDETYIREPMWLREDGDIPEVVPEGYCFVMGDNRNHSSDSRSKEIGLIANEDVIGKVVFILLPFNRIGKVK